MICKYIGLNQPRNVYENLYLTGSLDLVHLLMFSTKRKTDLIDFMYRKPCKVHGNLLVYICTAFIVCISQTINKDQTNVFDLDIFYAII